MNIILRSADFSDNNIGRLDLPVIKNLNLLDDDGSVSSLVLPPNANESLGSPIIVNSIGETPLGEGIIHTLTYTRAVQTSSVPNSFFIFPFITSMREEYVGKTGFGFWIKYERPAGSSAISLNGICTHDASITVIAPSLSNYTSATMERTISTGSSYVVGSMKTKVIASKVVNGETWYYVSSILDISACTGDVYKNKEIIVFPAFNAYDMFFNNGGVGDTITVKVANMTYGYFDDYLDPETIYPVY